LRSLMERHQIIRDVRGLGCFWAVELVLNRDTKEPVQDYGAPVSPIMAETLSACKQRGLLPFVVGNRVHMVPPLNISEGDAKEGIAMLDDALSTVGQYAIK